MDKKYLIKTCILSGTIFLTGCSSSTLCRMTVENDADAARIGEMAEIPLSSLKKISRGDEFRLLDSKGAEVPYQITYDSKLIFPVTVSAKSSATFSLCKGRPANVPQTACGRRYPERLDDMAWENDMAAYRAYGPALEAKGEKGFGYDLMNKRVPYPVLEKRYAKDLDPEARRQVARWREEGKKDKADSLAAAMSYHIDHGDGMDCYSVGPTLGGGTSALLDSGRIVYPYCYATSEVLDNGPLRFTVRLVFRPFDIGNDRAVTESRTISLDKGSNLNKTTVRYEHLGQPRPLVAGIVIHPQHKDGYRFDTAAGFISYADSTDNTRNDNGVIYVGAAFPDRPDSTYVQWFGPEELTERPGALGHVLGQTMYKPDSDFTYYWGCGWSKNGIAGFDAWNDYLASFVKKLHSPLRTTIKH